VVCNMHIMTRVGNPGDREIGYRRCVLPLPPFHRRPARPGERTSPGPARPWSKVHQPLPRGKPHLSYGSGYAATPSWAESWPCASLRPGQARGMDGGAHVILRLTSPSGRQFHIAAAFPSACGKTNLAMLTPTVPGWRCETIGDDIPGSRSAPRPALCDQPECGFFGVAPRDFQRVDRAAMETVKTNTIFTNCALTDDGDIWWEGMVGAPRLPTPSTGRGRTGPGRQNPGGPRQCPLHRPASQCPSSAPTGEARGRAHRHLHLRLPAYPRDAPVHEADAGTTRLHGATASSETTAANIGAVGNLRRDPFAMTPFCGYNNG
jgi:phosphoenolpyruvate carboxykinase (GTP)